MLQDAIRRWRARKEEKEEYAREQNTVEDFHRRKLDSDERELIRFKEEERKKRIKAELERYRKRDSEKVWNGKWHNPLYAKNVVQGHKKLFTGQNMFARVPNVVKQPNLFKQPDMFFGGKKRL